MLINRLNYKQFSDKQIFDSIDSGDLVMEGVGFLERMVILVTQSIIARNTKWKQRLAMLEKNNTELKLAVNEALARAGAEPYKFSEDKLPDLPTGEPGEKETTEAGTLDDVPNFSIGETGTV